MLALALAISGYSSTLRQSGEESGQTISLHRLSRARGFAFAAPVGRGFDRNQNFASDLHLARAGARIPKLIEL
jgi:hypothetical protein